MDFFDEYSIDWPGRDDEPCEEWDGLDVLNGDDFDVFVSDIDDAGDVLLELDEAELDIYRDPEEEP